MILILVIHDISSKEKIIVIDLIEEYLDKNRYFSVNKLIPFILSRTSKSSSELNREGIRIVLQDLAENNYICEGSKLTKNKILSNKNRKEIYDFIIENPGINFNRISTQLDLTYPVISWHLNTLIKFNFIRKKKIDNRECYFDINYDDYDLKKIYLLSNDKCKQVLDYILENSRGVVFSHIANNLGISRNTVKKYINQLEKNDLIYKEKTSKGNLIFLDIENYENLREIVRRNKKRSSISGIEY